MKQGIEAKDTHRLETLHGDIFESLSTSFFRPPMVWSKEHDILLCREILTYEPYNYKCGT